MEPRSKAKSELLTVSLVYPLVKFYTTVLVSIVGRYLAQEVLFYFDQTLNYSPRPSSQVEVPVECRYTSLYAAFCHLHQ